MVKISLFSYRNKLDVCIHFSFLNSIIMSIIRIVSLALMTLRYAMFLNDDSRSNAYEFIYLTFYGFVIAWIYFMCVVLDLIISKLIIRERNSIGRFLGDCVNVVYEVALSIQLTLTLLYWIVLYTPDTPNAGGFDNIGFHGMPLILLLTDFTFNSYQFPISHVIVTFIVGGIYLIINQVRTCDGNPVYAAYQCGNVWLPIVAFLILAIGHAIGHLVWRFFREKAIKKKIGRTDSLLQSHDDLTEDK